MGDIRDFNGGREMTLPIQVPGHRVAYKHTGEKSHNCLQCGDYIAAGEVHFQLLHADGKNLKYLGAVCEACFDTVKQP